MAAQTAPGRVRLALLVAVLGVAAVVVALARGQQPGDGSAPRLPDLVQRAPQGVFVTEEKPGRFELAFDSRVENHGTGVLQIEASRPHSRAPRMRARQILFNEDGSQTRTAAVGWLEYVASADHSHWHYLDFDRYSLRRLGRGSLGRDRKTGFCLGDRYEAQGAPATSRAQPEWDESCGADKPGLLRVREGISPGFGDDYPPALEGQSIDITGLEGGDYRLVQHVNPGDRLRESDYANNVAAAIVRIRWPQGSRGLPAARLISSCEAARRC